MPSPENVWLCAVYSYASNLLSLGRFRGMMVVNTTCNVTCECSINQSSGASNLSTSTGTTDNLPWDVPRLPVPMTAAPGARRPNPDPHQIARNSRIWHRRVRPFQKGLVALRSRHDSWRHATQHRKALHMMPHERRLAWKAVHEAGCGFCECPEGTGHLVVCLSTDDACSSRGVH